MDKKMAVLDTNIFLHYALPSDMDWCKLLEAEGVDVVITRKVMSELNRHKDSRNQKRESKRAAVAIRYIAKTFSGAPTCEIRPGVNLVGSNKVAYRIDTAMHQEPVKLPPVYVVYDDRAEPSPFQIEYGLSSRDLPNRVSGHLNVIVSRKRCMG